MMSNVRLRRLRRHVARQGIAYLALFVALTGTATAASALLTGADIVDGSLSGGDIRNGSISSVDVANGSILGRDVRNGSITAADLSEAAKRGMQGSRGVRGATGPAGPRGAAGADGADGATGANGAAGADGDDGTNGAVGPMGLPGAPGADGTTGPLAFAQFYALMPGDNAATVGIGQAVDFPQNGPAAGPIQRISADSFELTSPGTYRIAFVVSIDEPAQLVLTLNGAELPYTVVGRATGTSQVVGLALVDVAVPSSILEVRNSFGSPSALTITPVAGGASAVSASLVIERIA